MKQLSEAFSQNFSGKENLCGLWTCTGIIGIVISSLPSWLADICAEVCTYLYVWSFNRMWEGGAYTAISVWVNDMNEMLLNGEDFPQIAAVVVG